MTSINGVLTEVSFDVQQDLEKQNEVQICSVRIDKTHFDGVYSVTAVDDTGAVYTTLVRKIGPEFEKLSKFVEVKKNA